MISFAPRTSEPTRPSSIVIRPMLGPEGGIDVTDVLIWALARELARLHGGNEVLNWLEAEGLLFAAMHER